VARGSLRRQGRHFGNHTSALRRVTKVTLKNVVLGVLAVAAVFVITLSLRSENETRIVDWYASPLLIPRMRCVNGFKFYVRKNGDLRAVLNKDGDQVTCDQ
jgi:hypothetical protein